MTASAMNLSSGSNADFCRVFGKACGTLLMPVYWSSRSMWRSSRWERCQEMSLSSEVKVDVC